jgi:hypothetical protein
MLRGIPLLRRPLFLGGCALIAAAIAIAPLAMGAGEGGAVRGGARNPTNNTGLSYHSETQIIAENSTYGTRQSNKGTGGGAIYGCRSAAAGNGCIAAVNLKNGPAFAFTSGGASGGRITLSNTTGAPLTTNAKGIATGFNANYLEGKQAKDFVPATQAASFAQQSQLLFAVVSQTGALGAQRGAKAAAKTGEKTYTVTFETSVAKCSLTASPIGAALTTGSLGVAVQAANTAIVEISAPSALAEGFNLQVVC